MRTTAFPSVFRPGSTTPWREVVREVLVTLAAQVEHLEFGRDSSISRGLAESVVRWRKDAFQPQSADFREQFSERELQALSRLNACVEQYLRRLPLVDGSFDSWLVSESLVLAIIDAQEALSRPQPGDIG